MKTKLLTILCLIILSASKCKKEGDDCHYEITFINNSNVSIIWASRSVKLNDDSQCILKGIVINPYEKYLYRPYNWCIENSIGTDAIEFFFLDYNNNLLDQYFACDSIYYYNNVFKHDFITIDFLKRNNFTITYP